jgi:hypothetical protein
MSAMSRTFPAGRQMPDARWLAKPLVLGLVEGRFVLPKKILELRDLNRGRQKLVSVRSSEYHSASPGMDGALHQLFY